MDTSNEAPRYRVWGADDVAYGPVELTNLSNWVLDERVTASTWVYAEERKGWLLAADLPELAICFDRLKRRSADEAARQAQSGTGGIRAGSLRRIKLLAA